MSNSLKPFQIPFLCIVGVSLCLIPHFISSPSKLVYDVNKSSIYASTKSDSYYYVSMITLGCCIPMVFEYILDVLFFGVRKDKRLRYLTRGILIFILFVPELIIFYYVIPADREEYFGSIFTIRTVICACVSFYEIDANRGNIISSIQCLVTMILIILAVVIRSFTSVISFSIADILQILLSISVLLALITLSILWFRKLLTMKFEEWDTSQLICSIYLIFILFMSIAVISVRFIFGPINNNSSIECLVANKIVQALFVVILSVSHSRIIRNEIIQTQLRNNNNNIMDRSDGRASELLSTLKETQASCDVAVEILNDLLAYEKLEAGIMTLEAKEIQIWSFIKETLRPFSVSAMDHSILCLSLMEETSSNKRSTIGVNNRRLRMDVTDTGHVSKSLVDLHDGILSVTSEGIGYGCTFTIELPVFTSTSTTTSTFPTIETIRTGADADAGGNTDDNDNNSTNSFERSALSLTLPT
eukprot:gene11085-23178_t